MLRAGEVRGKARTAASKVGWSDCAESRVLAEAVGRRSEEPGKRIVRLTSKKRATYYSSGGSAFVITQVWQEP